MYDKYEKYAESLICVKLCQLPFDAGQFLTDRYKIGQTA